MNPEIQEKLDQQADYIAGKRDNAADCGLTKREVEK